MDIVEERSGVASGGGVDGGNVRVFVSGRAGEGDTAKNTKRSAPSLPALACINAVLKALLREWVERARSSGGVRGVRSGEERM